MLKCFIRGTVAFVVALFLVTGTLSSCSKSENGDNIEPVNPEKPYIGSWRIDFDEYEIVFLVIDSGSKVTCYSTDPDLLNKGKYEDKTVGSYTYDAADNLLTCMLNGDKIHCQVIGSGTNAYIVVDGERAKRVKSSDVPKKPYDSEEDDEEENTTIPSGPVSVTTLDCKQTEQLKATFHCKVSGASNDAEIGFYLGFDSNFERETYRKIKVKGGKGDVYINTIGIYGDQKYYYRAYVIDKKKEYLGAVKSFESMPVQYTINGKTFRPVLIKDGPYGDFYMFPTEIPTDETFKFDDDIFGPMDFETPFGECTAYEYRTTLIDIAIRTGLPIRVPTTSEWKMAYRGGYESNGHKYSGSDDIDDVAWYKSNSKAKMHAVASKQPNELGIYDLCGNLSEPICDYQIGQGFSTHNYVNYRAINGTFADNKAFGGNFNSRETDCTADSYIAFETQTDVFDGGKIGLRYVYSLDPAYEPVTE